MMNTRVVTPDVTDEEYEELVRIQSSLFALYANH